MKILNSTFINLLSLFKVFGTAILLLICNLSRGLELPGNLSISGNTESSFQVISDLNLKVTLSGEEMIELINWSTNLATAPAPDPASTTVCQGGNATFSVTTLGTYQWQEMTILSGVWIDLPGETAISLNRIGVANAMNGNQYRVVVNRGAPSLPATLTVNPLPLPTFTTQPGGATICAGLDVTYTTEPFMNNYLWGGIGILNTDYSITSGGVGLGSNTVTLKWLTAGNKIVTINYTDGNGCKAAAATLATTTNVNGLPVVTFGGVLTPQCQQSISYILTGGIPLGGIYSGPGVTGTNFNATLAGPGTHTITYTYTDGNGCTNSATNTIVVNPTFTSQPGSSTCIGFDVTYTTQPGMTNYIWILPGTLGTDYSITSGSITATSDFVMLKWLTPGIKILTILYTDSNGCTAPVATSSITTIVNALPIPTFTAQPGVSACAGSPVTYTTEPGMTNYIWDVPGILNTDYSITSGGIGANSNTVTLRWMTTGNKVVTISYTDGNGCTAAGPTSSIVTLVNPKPAPTYIIQPGASVCAGSDVTYSTQSGMSNYIWVVPGTVDVDYSITSGSVNTASSNVTLKWLTAGNRIVTINYANGFGCFAAGATSSTPTVVNAPPVPPFIAQPGISACAGSDVTYSTTSGMSNYTWIVPGAPGTDYTITSGNFAPTSSTVTLKWLTAGIKTLTINYTDGGGCTAAIPTSSTPTTVNDQPIPAFISQAGATACTGLDITYATQPGMTNYRWLVPGILNTDFSISSGGVGLTGSSVTLKWLTAGIKTVTISYTDGNGCTAAVPTSSAATTVNAIPGNPGLITPLPASAVVCKGSSVNYSVIPFADPTVTYIWRVPAGATFIPGVNPYEIVVTYGLSAVSGDVSVNGTNACGNGVVSLLPVVIINPGIYGPYCLSDGPVNLIASPAGGTYSGPGVTAGNIFDPATAGIGPHSIKYTSPGASCQVTLTINVVSSTVVVKTNNTALMVCNGTADLTLSAITAGSEPGLVFTYWNDLLATQPVADPTAVSSGTWYIKGATASGNCFDIKPVIVAPSNALQAKLIPVSPNCSGSATGSIDVVVTKGTAPYTYVWNTNPVQSTALITNLVAGIYTVTLTDANLCSITLTDTLKDHPGVRIYISHKDIQCMSDANGSARVDSINGSGKPTDLNLYSYKWNTNPAQTTREATRLSSGYHSVIMADKNGCAIKDSVLINVLDTIPPSIDCRKDTITIIEQSQDLTVGSPNNIVVDLGNPVVWDNCGVATLTNDSPEKYRVGITEVIWTVTDYIGYTATCKQAVYIKAIPTVSKLFSPNGDGVNDFFEIDGLAEFPKTQLAVFTRSGQLVFSSDDYKSEWDGKFQTSQFFHNQKVATGVYYYVLSLGGTTQQIKGFVYVTY